MKIKKYHFPEYDYSIIFILGQFEIDNNMFVCELDFTWL